uniref:F-box domain-containing protein n=1 Tax=Cacopsylla melanoneura TaxID=428564 RepID=A0A8D8Y1G2_9HEMI
MSGLFDFERVWFGFHPIKKNIIKYLSAKDLQTLSLVSKNFKNVYFEFNRELKMDHYDEDFYSKFEKIEKLELKSSVQNSSVPEDKLSVLVSLTVPSIDKNNINLIKCRRLKELNSNNLGELGSEDFPLSLKKITCQVLNCNINHLVQLKEIDISRSSISDETVDNFPDSLESVQMYRSKNISNFNIRNSLVNLKELDCSHTPITDDAVNNFPVSLEKLILTGCNISNFNINRLANLKQIDCSGTQVTDRAVNNFPISLEQINLAECRLISDFNINHLFNLTDIDFSYTLITDETVNKFPISLERIYLICCKNISDFKISRLVNLKDINCTCTGITDVAVNNFPISLERVILHSCKSLTDFNINHLLNLKVIDCSKCTITNVSRNSFPASLETVIVYGITIEY